MKELRYRAYGYSPELPNDGSRRFVAHFWLNGWDHISLGIHVSLTEYNVEIHIPFGFIRIGFQRLTVGRMSLSAERFEQLREFLLSDGDEMKVNPEKRCSAWRNEDKHGGWRQCQRERYKLGLCRRDYRILKSGNKSGLCRFPAHLTSKQETTVA